MPIDVAFRVDASLAIGTGHVMRCLTLADALREKGARCRFICRPHEGHLAARIREKGYPLALLSPPQEGAADATPAHSRWLGAHADADATETRAALTQAPDWLVVDHYALDAHWEKALAPAARKIMAIDDLADRPHDCALLLDPTPGRTREDYAPLLPPEADLLLGPAYALLRPAFARLRPESLARREEPQLRRILVTMGGVDRDNVTGRVLDALAASPLPAAVRIAVVMGRQAPWLADVIQKARRMPRPTDVLTDVRDMARLMADSDLAIGAAGSTCWERCCMGLPTLQIVAAENQRAVAARLAATGATRDLGPIDGLAARLPAILEGITALQLQAMSQISSQVCDGRGTPAVANRMQVISAEESVP